MAVRPWTLRQVNTTGATVTVTCSRADVEALCRWIDGNTGNAVDILEDSE